MHILFGRQAHVVIVIVILFMAFLKEFSWLYYDSLYVITVPSLSFENGDITYKQLVKYNSSGGCSTGLTLPENRKSPCAR